MGEDEAQHASADPLPRGGDVGTMVPPVPLGVAQVGALATLDEIKTLREIMPPDGRRKNVEIRQYFDGEEFPNFLKMGSIIMILKVGFAYIEKNL